MSPKTLAAKLRRIAQEAEAVEAECDLTSTDRGENGVDCFFTCNKVANACGYNVERAYRETFVDDAFALWRDGFDCMPRRVLMLCFAAAMAETGDLP